MSTLVFLDSGVVGNLINPDKSSENSIQCNRWLERLLENNFYIGMSEIADYENRREHIRRVNDKKLDSREKQRAIKAIRKLDEFRNTARIGHFPVSGEAGAVMLKAAELWAFARNNAYTAFDADIIIAAQAVIIKSVGINVLIATTDPEDFNRLLKEYFIPARRWRDITV